MRTRREPDAVEALLLRRRDLLEAGRSEREIADGVGRGILHRVRRGWFVLRSEYDRLFAEDRHLLHVLAVSRDVRGGGVVSHESAAVLHGLDLYRRHPRRVHLTTSTAARISSNSDVFRHCTDLDEDDITHVRGIRCTTLARTVFDVARTLPPEPALVIADGAERQSAGRTGGATPHDVAAWRDAMAERIARAAGARGIRRARWVTAFADGLAETTLESVSRFRLHQIGFRRVRLQVAVPAPRGTEYRVDFGLDDVDAWGECDGTRKYVDAGLRSGRSAEDVVLDEKRREDWIRGTTGRRLVRWEDAHVTDAATLAARLTAFGIRPPR
ncbi:type IV toxin-antitoxin system AbiEi family antitoxin domain-containing protein [Microbacterium oleivorans]|uniref:Transcriptional regulator, AbiEi antitoxin, Type IV TA system n=1 Tax=Microbacterium oleivorans TaxID=273677 RepID=A0A7D5EWR6_9MICO|nr:hypothetical protein [Microbacterium oleivorans]QLD11170.1 hypothetical protein HW566_04875 [Microbacterium oleivorans]